MATRSNLMSLQAPGGTLVSSRLRRVTDPISLTPQPGSRMRHFFEGVYDLSPQSHLSRFVKTLLGDAGVGYLNKVYAHAHSQSVLATMRYADLDAFYGDVLGLKRMSWEHTDPARYYTANTPSEWDEIEAKDASYRARIEAFSRAIGQGPTPTGLTGVASALLGVEVRLYEAYLVIDEAGSISGAENPLRPRWWGEVESDFGDYSTLSKMTYADIEGQYGSIGRANVNDRAHFTLRPMRPISSEEEYQLRRVADRFRPVGTMLSIDPLGLSIHSPVHLRGASSDSTHWEVSSLVHPSAQAEWAYQDDDTTVGAFEVPRPAQTNRQSEAWSYNGDIANMRSYREISKRLWPALPDPEDHTERITGVPEYWVNATRGLWTNYQRVNYSGGARDYTPAKALADHITILQGRNASNGVIAASPLITRSELSQQVEVDRVRPNLVGTHGAVLVDG